MQNKKYNLLYINDDETNLSSFEKYFHRDFNIITAKSVIDGLRILTKDGIHLVILDYQLPETSGLEFLKEVKNKYPDIKCILLTDHDGIKMFEDSFDSINLWRYIIKPYDATELILVIQNALEIYQLKIDKDKLLNELNFRVERYEKMMETAMDSIITINDKHEITEANKAACELFGYKLKELIGSPLNMLIPENKRKTHPKLVKSFSNSEQTKMRMGHDTYRYGLSSSGKKIPVEVTISKQMTGEGNFYNAFIRDVSNRLEKENEIRKSEANLKKAQRIAGLGLWAYDVIDDEFRWSDELYRILGMTPNEIKESSDSFYNCVHPDDRDGVRKSYYSSLKKKKSYDINYRLQLPDEPIKYANEIGEFVFDNNGKAIKSFGTIQDITKQVLAEQRIRESENRLKEAQKIAKLGHWTYTISEDKYNWSNELHRILGISPGKIKETAEIFYNCVHPDDREFVRETDANSLITKKPFNITYRLLLSDQSIKYVRDIGEFIYSDNGKAIKSIGTIQDITEETISNNNLTKINTAIDNSINEVYIFNATDLKFTYINKRVVEKLGYPLKKLKTMTPVDIKPEFSHDRFVKTILPLKKGEIDSLQFETFHQRSDKTSYPVEVNLSTFTIQNSLHYLAMIIDVSESKQLERERLKNIEITNRYIQESQSIASLGYYIYDYDTNKWDISEFVSKTMRLKSKDKSLEAWINTIHPEDRHLLIDILNKRQNEPSILLDVTYRIISPKNGNIRWIHHVSKAIEKDDKGNLLPSLGILQDITNQKLIEEKLTENTLLLKEAQRMAHLGNWQWDIATNTMTWSNELYNIYGLNKDTFKASFEGYIERVHPEDKDRVMAIIQGVLSSKEQVHFEERIIRPNKTTRYLTSWGNVVTDKDQNPIKMFGACLDITEQKQAEQELRISKEKIEESEKQFRELYEKSGDAILIIKNETFTDCNKATIDLLKFKSREEFLNTHPSKLSPKTQPDGLSSFEKAEEMMRIALEKGTHRFEWAHTKSNGGDFPVEVLLTTISNEPDNRVIHCVWRDITDRKKAEEVIIENNLQFSQLADNTSDVFGVGDVSDLKNIKWLYVNPAFELVWQQTSESLYQDPTVWFNPVHKEDRERLRTAFMNFIYEKNKKYNIKFRIVRTDKTIRYIHATANLIKDHNGKVIRFAGISRDITEQKKYEEKLVEKTTELEESLAILEGKNYELEQFAYISSHDLQEPLSTVSSFAELLDQEYRDKLDDDANTYLQFILDSTSRMRNLIHGLLEYSILGKGRTAERVDYNEILKFVLEDLQGVISEKQGKIESGPLPILNAYPIELRQLFANLISNALKYCREGVPPVINISSRKQNGTWEFKFKDNGIGIDKKFHEKIFVIFQRLHNKDDYDGTGIGLAHCRKIVELHNGRIWVESIPDKGSEFYFTIKM